MRRHVPGVWADVCISDDWGRDVFGTSDLGRTPDFDETSAPRPPSRRLGRRLHFGRLGTGCIWEVCFRSEPRCFDNLSSKRYINITKVIRFESFELWTGTNLVSELSSVYFEKNSIIAE